VGVSRIDLGVVAASKGLFAGHLVIHTEDGRRIDGCGSAQGCLIPPGALVERLALDDVRYVLIVEKEAVFRSLCSVDLASDARLGNGVIITGKGYPDIATRELVNKLSTELTKEIPIVCLVDGDPHGLEILSTYRFGSAKMAFDQDKLTVERIQWIGIRQADLTSFEIDHRQLLPLSIHDSRKALAVMSKPVIPCDWHRELSIMLHSHRKAEIEILSSLNSQDAGSPREDGLVAFVIRRVREVLSEADDDQMLVL